MRRLFEIVLTIFLTLAIGAIFKQPIEDRFDGNRLKALIIAGPWVPYPQADGKLLFPSEFVAGPDDIASMLKGDDRFAVLRLRNEGRAEISDASMKFKSWFTPDVYVPAFDKNPPKLIKAAQEVTLPVIRPGGEFRVYLWKNNSIPWGDYLSDIRTYSSQGGFRLSVDQPSTVKADENDSWVDESLEYALWGLGAILVAMLWVGSSLFEDYAKKLLKDETFYQDERVRFEAEGKKWSPTLLGQKAAKPSAE